MLDNILIDCFLCGKATALSTKDNSKRSRYHCENCFSDRKYPNGVKVESDFIYYIENGAMKWFLIYVKEMGMGLLINGWFNASYIQDGAGGIILHVDYLLDTPHSKEESVNLMKMMMTFQ